MNVLVVEDEALLAAEIEHLIAEAGMTAVGSAFDSREALALIERDAPDLALVDVHLLDGPTGVEFAREAVARHGVAAVFMTANLKRIPDDFAGACGVIPKPYTEWGMLAALKFVGACLETGGARTPAPLSIEIAPDWARRWNLDAAGDPGPVRSS